MRRMRREYNFILDSDGYKYSHPWQYPEGTTKVYAYIESRGGAYDKMILLGVKPLIELLADVRLTKADVDEAEEFCADYGAPFDRTIWDYIVDVHGGKLPLLIRTVDEGTILPVRNVVLDIVNTDDKCFWLTSFVETMVLRALWFMTTVGSRDLKIRMICAKYLSETSDEAAMEGLPFMLNDFGARGVSSYESAELGGLAHLTLFKGTDNTPAVKFARDVYGCRKIAGNTIAASEHSTITSWGRTHEVDAYANMVEKFKSRGILAVVSDSYNIYKAVDELWAGVLLDKVKNSGARVVIRPDSGDPTKVPLEVIRILMEKAGYTINSKGYKVLPSYFRVIQGDGVDEFTIEVILENMKKAGYAAENIVFGMGGAMLQKLDRDTMKFAMKTAAVMIDGVWIDVYKDPIDDKGKTSKKGRLELVKQNGNYITVRQDEYKFDEGSIAVLKVRFEDGEQVGKLAGLEEIREYVDLQLAA